MQTTSRFLRACNGLPVDRTPIWLMRQAGRYMAEYRALREQHSILDIIESAELSCAVTMQPIDAFDLDAAIIFADILPPLKAIGFDLAYIKGEGPIIHNPIRCMQDIRNLRSADPEEAHASTLAAIKMVNTQLAPRHIPLIGFAGAPFTLASYAIEGEGGTQRILLKKMMYNEPAMWAALMTMLAELSGNYLCAQAAAGAQVLQVFDSWVGELSPVDYRRFVEPYTRQTINIARSAGVPIIHFGTGTAGLLPDIARTGADIIGIDWRIDMHHAARILGPQYILQGNLDPALLFAPWEIIEPAVRAIIDDMGYNPRHIFNLGHGILPGTPIDTVARLVDFVHSYSERYHG